MPIIFIEREEEVIRALHLASFNGNIGDIANHVGFWNLFKKYVTNDVEVTYLEIREYYKSWNLRQFDDSFADLVNRYDLLVIGGGNFFDVKWDYSTTGTTLNISDEILRKIHIPIVFNGLGVDYSPNMCLAKVKDCFGSFIKYLDSRSAFLHCLQHVPEIPDCSPANLQCLSLHRPEIPWISSLQILREAYGF